MVDEISLKYEECVMNKYIEQGAGNYDGYGLRPTHLPPPVIPTMYMVPNGTNYTRTYTHKTPHCSNVPDARARAGDVGDEGQGQGVRGHVRARDLQNLDACSPSFVQEKFPTLLRIRATPRRGPQKRERENTQRMCVYLRQKLSYNTFKSILHTHTHIPICACIKCAVRII